MSRLSAISTRLNTEQTDALLVFYDHNITYLSGFTGHAATLLILTDAAYLLTDYRYHEQAKAQAPECTVICRDRVKQSLGDLIDELIQRHHIQSLAFEAEHISFAAWQQLSSCWRGVETKATSRWVEDLRYCKDGDEVEAIQQAARIGDQALAELLKSVKIGVTERELSIELEYQMAQLGSEEPAFSTIMLAGERSALPHGVPGDKALQAGDLLLIDFGAVIQGYRSDMTRTLVVGSADAKQKAIHQSVLSAQQAAMDHARAGINAHELHQYAKQILDQSPYGAYQGEGLGHGLGLDLHEQPFMGMGPDRPLLANSVVTIEPGIYIPGWGGVRIEDDVLITETGIKRLSQSPRALLEL